jgi:hypothetical protein
MATVLSSKSGQSSAGNLQNPMSPSKNGPQSDGHFNDSSYSASKGPNGKFVGDNANPKTYMTGGVGGEGGATTHKQTRRRRG